jgi:RNA 2',3'-cyclic 3'-phosphodiesterase
MPEQFVLPGLEATPARRPVERHNLFFAIVPDSDTALRIERLAQRLRLEHGLKGNLLPTAHFHVTLHFIGRHDKFFERVASWAQATASTVSMPAFDVEFDHVGSFQRKARERPVVLLGSSGGGVAVLKEFQSVLGKTLASAGFELNPSSFTPHLTLLYDRQEFVERTIEPVRWTVREFVLVDSRVGKTQHVQLARWPLTG